jgi:methylphosphotriester-DNA--protein-cysteine methyltransferase
MPGKRATETEVERRIERVVELLCEGAARNRICRTLREEVGVDPSTVDRIYIPRARARLVEMFRVKREDFVAQQLVAMEHIADKAIESGQLSAAVGARACILRVTGADGQQSK